MKMAKKSLSFSWQSNLFPLVAVLLLGVLLRAVYYSDQVLFESVQAAKNSSSIAQTLDEDVVQAIRELRTSPRADRILLPPTALLFRLFGITATSSAIGPIISSLLAALLLWATGKLMFSNGAGLIGALLWLILPAGVFLSTQLLATNFLVPLNILVVCAYLYAKSRGSSRLYVFAAFLAALGLWLHWLHMLASVVFIILDILSSNSRLKNYKDYIIPSLLLLTVLYLLASQTGNEALQVLYLTRLIEENLILLPLIVLCAAYAASTKEAANLQSLLLWFGTKLLIMVAGAHWIIADSLVGTIGVAAYWLDLLVPGMLLVGWALNKKLDEAQTIIWVPIICAGIAVLLLAGQANWLMTVSRIAFGLTLLLFMFLLAFWNAAKTKFKPVGLLFLTFFVLGSLTLNNWYWLSYRQAHDNTRQLVDNIAHGEKATLFVQEEELMTRLSYLAGFRPFPVQVEQTSLTFELVTADQSAGLPAGSYTAMSAHYRDFEFGAPLASWEPVDVYGTGPTQLLLFRVLP